MPKSYCNEPHLGLATTGQICDELLARVGSLDDPGLDLLVANALASIPEEHLAYKTCEEQQFASVLQQWVMELPMMQQSVLLAAVRGPDGLTKYHPSKYLLRWFRRCTLLSAMDGRVLEDPLEPNGGSFTGPSVVQVDDKLEIGSSGPVPQYSAYSKVPMSAFTGEAWGETRNTALEAMTDWVTAYISLLDEVPHHYQLHFLHAAEILGYKHPVEETQAWWNAVYTRLVRDMHLAEETMREMDHRLGDSREQWLEHADPATQS